MLKNLHIKNYAIIDEINIEFEEGLTIITGETGAGKSILIGALSLVLGERADSNRINSNKEKCVIEASFHISKNKNALQFLDEHDFESDHELIIRRELNATGKSRVFINDTPTTLSVLSELSILLLDLHRQFDNIDLQHHSHQLSILDEIATHPELLASYTETYLNWKKTENAYQTLLQNNLTIKKELDYNLFNFQEIEDLHLNENEIEQMESELLVLESAEAYKQSLQAAMQLLQQNETPIIPNLKQVVQLLESYTHLSASTKTLVERLNSSLIELKDIQGEMEDIFEKVYYDEEKISLLNERLNEANRLLKKHHIHSTDELIALKNALEQKILLAETADQEEMKLYIKTSKLAEECKQLAIQLSKNRKSLIPEMEVLINQLLQKVGMPNARFKVAIEQAAISKSGMDKVEFLFDANKTKQYKPIAKVASGGELSRLMLCIKSLVATSTELPTLIFDEIDTGISGETAIQVGNIMKQLSRKHQLISITHLPQIASKADQHLYIYKQENAAGDMHTFLKKLQGEERIDILAEMLSGKESSTQAKQMVKELMK